MRIAVLGCGWTGILSAYFMKKRFPSCDLVIIEKEGECGGLLKSETINGFVVDPVPHVLYSPKNEVIEELLSLLRGNYIKKEKKAFIMLGDKLVPHPFETGIYALPKEERARYGLSLISAYSKASCKGTLKEALEPYGEVANDYLIPYNEKVWKRDLSNLSGRWTCSNRFPRVSLEDLVSAIAGIEPRRKGYFYYPLKGGFASLFNAVYESVCKWAKFIKGAKVESIKKRGDQFIINDEIKADKVVNTIPLKEIISAVEAPESIISDASSLQYNSFISVALGVKGKGFDMDWVYIPTKKVSFHRFVFSSNLSPYNAPTNNYSITAEVTLPLGDKVDLKKVEEKVIDELEGLGIIERKNLVFVKSWYFKYGYPVYDIGYEERRNAVLSYLKDELGIESLGRWGRHEYVNTDAIFEEVKDSVNKFASSNP
ncbi:MAG: NAD(P)-binding protein [Caldisphaeraceae archaeon]|nr:NAD(P)-binding protein [Caldisphaeraceae archaeon]